MELWTNHVRINCVRPVIALYLHFVPYFYINDNFCLSLYHFLLILSVENHTPGQLLNVSLKREYNISTVSSCQQYDVAWSSSILTYVRNNLRNYSRGLNNYPILDHSLNWHHLSPCHCTFSWYVPAWYLDFWTTI